MLVAKLSDAHVGIGPGLLGGRMDTAAALRRAALHVAGLDPAPDVVPFTGDLTEHGCAGECADVGDALARLSMPVYAVPGNHDEPIQARETLTRCVPVAADAPEQSCCYHVRHGPLHLVALDTVVPRRAHGAIGAAQLQWLARTLDACRGEPVLLFMHHPPVPTGLAAMDACGLRHGADALVDPIRRHGAVQGALCVHRTGRCRPVSPMCRSMWRHRRHTRSRWTCGPMRRCARGWSRPRSRCTAGRRHMACAPT